MFNPEKKFQIPGAPNPRDQADLFALVESGQVLEKITPADRIEDEIENLLITTLTEVTEAENQTTAEVISFDEEKIQRNLDPEKAAEKAANREQAKSILATAREAVEAIMESYKTKTQELRDDVIKSRDEDTKSGALLDITTIEIVRDKDIDVISLEVQTQLKELDMDISSSKLRQFLAPNKI